MRIVGNNPQLSRQTQGTASGAITGGKPVVVNTDGTVTQISESGPSLGSATAIDGSGTGYVVGAFDSNSNKVVVGFQYQAVGTNLGRARVGTISGSSISFGDVVTFNDAATNYIASTFDSNSNKIVFAYQDDGNSSYGTAIVGTVSGTDISFGSETVFESATSYYINATFDSNSNKVVIVYTDAGNSAYGTAVVGTVSGTSISFGTPVVFESADSSFNDVVFDSSNNKVVVSYRDGGNSYYGTAIVGTVSGTSISFGSAVVYVSSNAIGGTIGFDSNSNKVVIAYKDNSDSRKGKAVVGTVSGTGISFGSAVIYEAGEIATGQKIAFDSNVNKFVIHYEDVDDSAHSKLVVGTVSGTSISFASETTTKDANKNYQYAVFDSSTNKFAILYNNEAKVFSNAIPTNITSENFIGFAEDTVATGQPVTINTKGAVDENQSSLTPAQQYFVQTDGTLGTSADDPSVVAGTAVTATKLIVKG
jgi:hypothetical protein